MGGAQAEDEQRPQRQGEPGIRQEDERPQGLGRLLGLPPDHVEPRERLERAREQPSSGAYGIPQALPGSKMSSAGPDWHNNAMTQISWGLGYVGARYGNPCKAWAFWQAHHWY